MKIRVYGDSDTIAGILAVGLLFEIFSFVIMATIRLLPLALKLILFLLKGIWKLIKWICRMIAFLVVYFKEKKK